MASLLTGNAKKWYLANKSKSMPDPQTGWVVWADYSTFLSEFTRVHENRNKVREAKRAIQWDYQKKGETIKVYVARMRTHNLTAKLSAETLWEHLTQGVLPEIRDYMRRTNKDSLDKVPASVEMCFEAITAAGMEVENDKAREAFTQAAHSVKVQMEAAVKGKEKAKEGGASKDKKEGKQEVLEKVKDKKNRVQKKKNQASNKSVQGNTGSDKKEKEKGEDTVTREMRQARMKDGVCVKCGKKGHIKNDCTNGWKATPKKEEKPAKAAGESKKKVAMIQAASPPPVPYSFGRITELSSDDDELDYGENSDYYS